MRMLRETVEAQIGYDAMSEEYGKDRLDEIVSLMVEILCTTSPTPSHFGRGISHRAGP